LQNTENTRSDAQEIQEESFEEKEDEAVLGIV